MEREHTDEHTLEDCFNYFWQLLNHQIVASHNQFLLGGGGVGGSCANTVINVSEP